MYVETFNQLDSGSDFCVLYAGDQQCPAGHAYGGIRDHWLMHFVVAGQGSVRVAGQRHELGPGEAFLFPPGQAHQYAADRRDPWHYVWIGFAGREASGFLAGSGFGPGSFVVKSADPKQTNQFFQDLIHTLASGNQSPHDEIRRLGLAILDCFRSGGPISGSSGVLTAPATILPVEPVPERDGQQSAALAKVRQLVLFFDTHYHRPIGIKQAADWVHLDRTYCARIFRQHTGTSMHDYLTSIRMLKARQLLLTTDLPIKAVASSVGFMDYPTFAKRFHAENGTTPQAFRSKPCSSEPRGKPR